MADFDITKPVQCRDGGEYRIAATDGPGRWPIVGWVKRRNKHVWIPAEWSADGSYIASDMSHPYDLINVPSQSREIEAWAAVGKLSGTCHGVYQNADDAFRRTTVMADGIVVRLTGTYTEGE